MRSALEADPGLEVVGEAGDGRTGLKVVESLEPDVALLDISMPGMDGLEAIPEIRTRSPGTRIVVFSGFSTERMGRKALDLGATSYVEKGESLERLAAVVREAVDRPAA